MSVFARRFDTNSAFQHSMCADCHFMCASERRRGGLSQGRCDKWTAASWRLTWYNSGATSPLTSRPTSPCWRAPLPYWRAWP
eukprot:1669407-Pyramimonas_sp.AAC.1